MAEIPLILFAKAPIVGRVKTRLQSHCSPEQATEIAKILLEQTILKTSRAWPGEVLLSVWLDHDHEFIQLMQARYSLKLVHQCEGDLGAKMAAAFDRFGYPAVVMGCDVPHIPDYCLAQAHQQLANGNDVIGPSDDGGYYLLGLQASQAALFHNMQWGVSSVLDQTLQTADQLELNFSMLEELNDIDEWSDLQKAAPQIPTLMRFLEREGLAPTR